MAIESDPVLSTSDLCQKVYPGANRIEKKHRVAVLRAMRKLASKRDDLRIEQGGEGVESLLYRAVPANQYKSALSAGGQTYRRCERPPP